MPSHPTVAEREAELAALQSAFDEYIASSRELEEELDAELAKMQEKLAESSAANAALSSQLENIAPQLSSLEKALGESRTKLKEEQRLRRLAESSQDDLQNKLRELDGSLAALRDECDAAHEELAFKENELEETKLELDVERERHRVELEEAKADAVAMQQHQYQQYQQQQQQRNIPSEYDNRDMGESVSSSMAAASDATASSSVANDTNQATGVLEAVDEEGLTVAAEESKEREEYVKRLEEELELVTEQLIDAEQRLANLELIQKMKATEEKAAEQQQQLHQQQNGTAVNKELQVLEEQKQELLEQVEELTLKLEEAKESSKDLERRLTEELEVTKEELRLTQDVLRATEEDGKKLQERLDAIRTEHRDELQQLRASLDESESQRISAEREAEALETIMKQSTAEIERLQDEINNLEVALENANKDNASVMEELEAVNERFDQVRQEAARDGQERAADEARAQLKTEYERQVSQLQAQMSLYTNVNSELQQKVKDLEASLAAAQDAQIKRRVEQEHQNGGGGGDDASTGAASTGSTVAMLELQSKRVRDLQAQLDRAQQALEQQDKDTVELKAVLEQRMTKAEETVVRLEKELAVTKGELAETQAHLIVSRRENSSHRGLSPAHAAHHAAAAAAASVSAAASPTAADGGATGASRQVLRKAPSITSSSMNSSFDESRDDVGPLSEFDASSSRRGLRGASSRRRSRSSSPSTPERVEYKLVEEAVKSKKLQEEVEKLKDQKRMGEVRVKRLEEDLRVLQMQMFGGNDSAAVVTQMSRLSSLGSTKNDTMNAVVSESVEEVINSRDPKRISDELRVVYKKYCAQREYNAQLLSKILSLQGNIQVFCRVRPMKVTEIEKGYRGVVEALSESEVGCFDSRTKAWKSFGFDRVWGPDQTQQSIFQDVEPLALSVVDGYNACIFAYGQTGSGKTYTMEGTAEQGEYGISYRTIQKIFHLLSLRAQQQLAANSLAVLGSGDGVDEDQREPEDAAVFEFSLTLSMLEIYNEEVFDLLAVQGSSTAEKKLEAIKAGGKSSLEIRQNQDGRIEVPNLTKELVTSIEDVMKLLKRGNANRATASTDLNEHSSRSHMVLLVEVSSGMSGQPRNKGTLYLVDLAGSERVRKSNVEGEQLREAGFINKSLSALGNVMEALDRRASHVPYRDSKLTYLLQNSLGGNSRTMMVVTVCPMDVAFDESTHALQFATRVRRIQLGAAQRNVTSKNLEETVKTLTTELKALTSAKERSERQLLTLKRDNTRIQDKLQNLSKSRAQTHSDSRTLEVLKKNSNDMATRWQKEKNMREEALDELEKSRKELRRIQQLQQKAVRDNETLVRQLEEKENQLAECTKELREAKEASSAANIRARKVAVLNTRPAPATKVTVSPPNGRPQPPAAGVTYKESSTASSPPPKRSAAPSSDDVAEIRQKVLVLLEKHDRSKLNRIDIIMEKFEGKEALLLEKMVQRYEGSPSPTSTSSNSSVVRNSMKARREQALEKHKERFAKKSAGA